MEVKIAAVIVVYNQPILEAQTYQSFLKNADIPFMLYDNSKSSQPAADLKNCTYVHDETNPGVSKAYNKAIDWAKSLKATHLLLLDSDSIFPNNSCKKYKDAAKLNANSIILPSLFSAGRKISPFFFINGKTRYGEQIEPGELELGTKMAINAGTLLPLSILKEGLKFHEQLKLDWSDIYFFKKLAVSDSKAFHIPLKIQHGLSEHEERSLSSAQFRFRTYMQGISIVAENLTEKVQIYGWSKLKAMKLSWQYKTTWFLKEYFLNLK